MSLLAGQYTGTYNALAVGQIAEGITLEHTFFKRLITGDNWADSPQDAILRGGQLFTQYTLMEWDSAAAASLMWPYGTSYLSMGRVGRLDVQSGLVKSLVLTAVADTPAASSPATMTLARAILAEGYPISILYAPDLRSVPIRQRVYHNSSGVFGTLT